MKTLPINCKHSVLFERQIVSENHSKKVRCTSAGIFSECQMRIKLLKKMYRQTNEAMKRGDVFQQRPCPFYNEMDRIFSGNDDSTNPSGLSNSQSSLLEEEEDDIDEDIEPTDENQIFTNETSSNGDKFAQAIDRLIEYQKQNEVNLSIEIPFEKCPCLGALVCLS